MINSFKKKHPWLTEHIKERYWSLLEKYSNYEFFYYLYDWNFHIKLISTDESVSKPIFFGYYEKETVSFITKYISYGDTVVDVGANIGFFTLIFSKLVGENGKVHAFEPSQREFLHLCENVGVNKFRNILLNQLALSNRNGFSEMNVLSESRFGAYNSLRRVSHSKVQNEKAHIENVRTLTLDSYLALFPDAAPSLIKIDVEGFEKQVLEGMQSVLRTNNPPCLIIEICEGTHKDEQGTAEELITYIESFGYNLFSLNSVGNLIPFSMGMSLNCIALKKFHLANASKRGVAVGI